MTGSCGLCPTLEAHHHSSYVQGCDDLTRYRSQKQARQLGEVLTVALTMVSRMLHLICDRPLPEYGSPAVGAAARAAYTLSSWASFCHDCEWGVPLLLDSSSSI